MEQVYHDGLLDECRFCGDSSSHTLGADRFLGVVALVCMARVGRPGRHGSCESYLHLYFRFEGSSMYKSLPNN